MPTWNYWLLNYISGEIAAHFHLFPVRLSFQARRLPACYLPARIFCLRSLPGWDLFVCMHGFSTPACFVTSKGELWHLPVFRFSDIVKNPRIKHFLLCREMWLKISFWELLTEKLQRRSVCVRMSTFFSPEPDEQVGSGGEWRRCLMTVITHLSPTPGRDQWSSDTSHLREEGGEGER